MLYTINTYCYGKAVSGKKIVIFLRRLASNQRFPGHLTISIYHSYPHQELGTILGGDEIYKTDANDNSE
jgi:hypothetical protein